ncbi:TlpA family protein disulfide reductase [Stieleria sp. TO1_6]|uniref:TlpA family protein disulfide reductase n=1 Tax=Stieleria tagensis TaxID=2956795 RepID=UPI00209AB045|nr:TlpA disulfide reductase family protein [Stieleria tagensis]MCO8120953.1 TlpA family protein disulfide reductase [Stieleria tagensis]
MPNCNVHGAVFHSLLSLVLLTGISLLPGCSSGKQSAESDNQSSDDPSTPGIDSAADLMAKGVEPDVGADSFTSSKVPLPDSANRADGAASQRSLQNSGSMAPAPPNAPPAGSDAANSAADRPTGFPLAEQTPAPPGVLDQPREPSDGSMASRAEQRSFRDDLTPNELAGFLEGADHDMQLTQTKMADQLEASKMMKVIAKKKLEAAQKLIDHSDASEAQRIAGRRGQLQALSHLAAMGDVTAADELETLAETNLESPEATIASDSRIVLIGFAVDDLQAGKPDAADKIVTLVEGVHPHPSSDIPSILVMGRARQMLARYGQLDHAAKIRERILSLYGESSDKLIAKVATDAAGTTKFESADRLLLQILGDENVTVDQWSDVVRELISQAPDMETVQYLASAALQLEAADRDPFVEATFSLLQEQFTDPEEPTTEEVQTADKARKTRQQVIGTRFDFDRLPSVDGKGVNASEYQGKIVLMPFWAISFPYSLQVVPMLKEIQQRHPDEVVIVGMNLDPEEAPLRESLAQQELGFPSFRSLSSATQSVANPVAARFGLVSLPFVAVFNQQGYVEALDFTGRQLESIVDQLIKN